MSGLDAPLATWCADEEDFALVPTMGALHDGHLALIAEGKRRCARVMATIFVNPLQFNDPKDLERYPRTLESDLAKLEAAGCDLVWLPTADELYPDGFASTVHVAGVSDRWEGEHRPGHFDGVATVVAKLLIATLPSVAIFGEKDFQQLAVIRRMERDLGIGVTIVGHPTVRDKEGLALSSRNALLSSEQKARAPEMHRLLQRAASQLRVGVDPAEALASVEEGLASGGFGPIDYVALVDEGTLEPLDHVPKEGAARLIAAVFLGDVRLIDNICVAADTV